MTRASGILAILESQGPHIVDHGNGKFHVGKGSGDNHYVYDPQGKNWIHKSAFVHSGDWKGVTFDKVTAEKHLEACKK